MPSWHCLFKFGTFLSITRSKSRCISTFSPSLSPFCCFPMLIVYSAVLLCFVRFHIFLQNCFASLSYGYWLIFVHSSPTCCWKVFLCFVMSRLISVVLSFLHIFLVFLLSTLSFAIFPLFCIVCFTCYPFFSPNLFLRYHSRCSICKF